MSEELTGLEKELAAVIEAEKAEMGVVEEPAEGEEAKNDAIAVHIPEGGLHNHGVEEPKAEEPAKEEPKEEPKPASPDVYFKLREEARKREALEKELAELKQPKATIPSADEDIEGHLTAKVAQLEGTLNNVLGVVGHDLLAKKEEQELESAFSALEQYEKRLSSEKPDYEAARNHVAKIYAEEYKLKNPNLNGKQLIQAVAKEIINLADYAASNNQDPAASIYDRASLYGYRPEAKQEVKQEAVKKQPDLAKIAANKEKSAGMAAGAGSGAANGKTFEDLERMSNEEREALSDTDWKRAGV